MINLFRVAPSPSEFRWRGAWRTRCARCTPAWQYFADRDAGRRWRRWHTNMLHSDEGGLGLLDGDELDARRRAEYWRRKRRRKWRRWWQAYGPPVLAVLVIAVVGAVIAAMFG